jgi:VWFA-related protein
MTWRILLFLLCGLALRAQETATFRTTVSQVRVDVLVEQDRKVLTTLTRDDFVVFDENSPQPVSYFGAGDEPLHVLLLIDVSGSMRRFLEPMAQKARKSLDALAAKDRVAVMVFTREAELVQSFTLNRDAAAREIEVAVLDTQRASGTAVNASLLAALAEIRRDETARAGRRAVLIFTDNGSLNYKAPDEEVLAALDETDTVLNAIVTANAKPPKPPKPGEYRNPDYSWPDVFKLSEASGGEAVKAEKADEAFPRLLERIRSRYSLHYAAPGGAHGSYRRIRVELSPAAKKRFPRAVLRYRPGYRAD